jgi:hypothetical protein
MVQIIPQTQGIGVAEALDTLGQKLQKYRENKALKELSTKWDDQTNPMDMLNDIASAPVSNESKQLYINGIGMMMKQKAEESKLKQKQGLLSQFGIGGDQQQPQDDSNLDNLAAEFKDIAGVSEGMPTETPQQIPSQTTAQQPKSSKIPKKYWTEQEIANATAIDPNLGRVMMDQNKMRQRETIQSRKDIAESYKITQPYRDSVLKAHKSYQTDKMILDRMTKLNEGKGDKKLISAFKAKLADTFNIPISIVGNPESEEFDKLTATMTRTVKDYYGARITQFELETFLKSIPSLMNSQEGRTRIIRGLSILNEPREMEYKTLQEVRKQHKGRALPFDLAEEITERMESKLDTLAEEFKSISSSETTEAAAPQVMTKMPSPSAHKGKIIRDDKTGKRYKSTGKSWKEIK